MSLRAKLLVTQPAMRVDKKIGPRHLTTEDSN